MKKTLRTLALSVAALGLAALGGCAHYDPIMTDIPGTRMPTAQQLKTQLKGHAFEVGTVKVDLNQYVDAGSRLPPPQAKQYHPLPDWAYAKLLKWELDKAFKNAKLAGGTQPAYKVNVTIQRMSFNTNIGAKGSYIYSMTAVSGSGGIAARIPLYTSSIAAFAAVNNVCPEMRMRQQIPGQAAGIALLVHSIQAGKSLSDTNALLPKQYVHWAPANYLMNPYMYIGSGGQDAPALGKGLFGIDRLTVEQARSITGLPFDGCN